MNDNFLKCFFITIIISLFPICSYGIDAPTKRDYENTLENTMPSYYRLAEYTIDASEKLGNEVEPVWVTRFRAKIITEVELYKSGNSEQVPKGFWSFFRLLQPLPRYDGVQFLEITKRNGADIEIYGKTITKIYKGKLKIEFSFDGEPFTENGLPYLEFTKNGYGAIPINSDLEKNYYSAIENYKLLNQKLIIEEQYKKRALEQARVEEERRIIVEQERLKVEDEQKKHNLIANSIVLLSGFWKSTSESNSYMAMRPTGEMFLIYQWTGSKRSTVNSHNWVPSGDYVKVNRTILYEVFNNQIVKSKIQNQRNNHNTAEIKIEYIENNQCRFTCEKCGTIFKYGEKFNKVMDPILIADLNNVLK